jgi:hypothetical protein
VLRAIFPASGCSTTAARPHSKLQVRGEVDAANFVRLLAVPYFCNKPRDESRTKSSVVTSPTTRSGADIYSIDLISAELTCVPRSASAVESLRLAG